MTVKEMNEAIDIRNKTYSQLPEELIYSIGWFIRYTMNRLSLMEKNMKEQ